MRNAVDIPTGRGFSRIDMKHTKMQGLSIMRSNHFGHNYELWMCKQIREVWGKSKGTGVVFMEESLFSSSEDARWDEA